MSKTTEFKQEYLCSFTDENGLYDLAREYHKQCEDYDRKVCTGPIINGSIMFNNEEEKSASIKNAIFVRNNLLEKAKEMGYSNSELARAIRTTDNYRE